MAKIYQSPIDAPTLDFKNVAKYDKDILKFKKELKEYLQIRKKNDDNVGEVIKFQVADSYAEYMVASTSPPELVHLRVWDEWSSETAPLMTAKSIKDKVKQNREWEEFMNKNKK